MAQSVQTTHGSIRQTSDSDPMPGSTPRQRAFRFSAFVLAATLLVAVGVAMVLSIRGLTRSTEWVEHTYQVMAAAEATRASARSVESSARGYRLSGRGSLLAEYVAAVPHPYTNAAELVALTVDNAGQQRRAKRLQVLVDQRLAELQHLVDLQNEQGIERARRESLSSPGVEQMRRLNGLTEQILTEERVLLAGRHAETVRQANLMTVIVVAGIVLPLVLLGMLLWGMVRENRRSRALEREAQNAMRELADSLQQRDRLSEQRRVLNAYTGLLQSCQGVDEAMNVTAQIIAELLPHSGGRCYVLRPSQNLAETAATFGQETVASDSVLQPDSCWALRRSQPHRSGVGVGNVRCAHLHIEGAPDDAWTLCVPLIAQGTSLGMLHLNGVGSGSDEYVALVAAIAEQLSLAMNNLQLRESLRVQSIRDSLTGLYNRRYLEENLQREILRCDRRGLPLSVLMLDVDHFKRFNDQHGHAAGDALLASIAQTLQAMTREEDIACRYGGEEFTVVLPETDSAGAQRRAEEIRKAIAATTVLHLRQQLGPNTASLGIATFPDDARTPHELLELADAALYRAKAEGRDRVAVHGQAAP